MLSAMQALSQHTAAKTAVGIAVLPPLLIIVYMLVMTLVRWRRVQGSASRKEVLDRAVGRRQASVLTAALIGYSVVLLVVVAILRP